MDRDNCTIHLLPAPVTYVYEPGINYILPLICIIGIVLNILNLVVVRLLKGQFYLFLKALAVADLVVLVFIGLFRFTRCYGCATYSRLVLEVYVLVPLSSAAITCSIWITVALTIQRVVLVSNDNLQNRQWSGQSIVKLNVTIAVVALIFNVPKWFEAQVGCTRRFETGSLYRAYRWIHVIVVRIVPLAVLSICNISLIVSLRRYRRLQRARFTESNPRRTADNRQTLTLAAIVVMFVVGNTPQAILDTAKMADDSAILLGAAYLDYMMVCAFMEALSFALNFVFYCVLNRQFTDSLRNIVSTKLCQNPRPHLDRNETRVTLTGASLQQDVKNQEATNGATMLLKSNEDDATVP